MQNPAPFAVLALIAAAAGCASAPGPRLSEEPAYAAGFGDGCTTSTEENKSFSTKRVRDDYLFREDRGYRAGWRQGYLECGETFREPDNGGRILGEEDGF